MESQITNEAFRSEEVLKEEFLQWVQNAKPEDLNDEMITDTLSLISDITQYDPTITNQIGSDKKTDLMFAIESGLTEELLKTEKGIEIFNFLAGDSTKINLRNSSSDTALSEAAISNMVLTAGALIERGADLELHCNHGDTPLIAATERNHLDVVKLLIERGANLNAIEEFSEEDLQEDVTYAVRETALTIAATRGHVECARLLIDAGSELNKVNSVGQTALMKAAAVSGSCEISEMLIEKGADINARSNRGLTALQLAAQSHHEEVFDLLLEKGAEILVNDLDCVTESRSRDVFSKMVVTLINRAKEAGTDLNSLGEKLQDKVSLLNEGALQVASDLNLINLDLPTSSRKTLVSGFSSLRMMSNKTQPNTKEH